MNFTWHDGERVVRFGAGAAAASGDLLGEGYTVLTTARARDSAPAIVDAAAAVHEVPAGRVDELAAALLGEVRGELLVALGGGRVVDVAKALAGATGARAAAVPTTLSAAEMTRGHRLPAGVDGARHVRPAIVVNDPLLSASQPLPGLAASAANSLAHAIEGRSATRASPVPTLEAREAERLIDAAFLVEDEPLGAGAREQLALAALLSGATIDSAGYGLHHVLAQTTVRLGGAGHGPANACLLPHTIGALERRAPGRVDPDGSLAALAAKLARLAQATRLRDLGVAEDALGEVAAAAAERPDLDGTPPRADADELADLLRAAW